MRKYFCTLWTYSIWPFSLVCSLSHSKDKSLTEAESIRYRYCGERPNSPVLHCLFKGTLPKKTAPPLQSVQCWFRDGNETQNRSLTGNIWRNRCSIEDWELGPKKQPSLWAWDSLQLPAECKWWETWTWSAEPWIKWGNWPEEFQ